MRGTWIGTLLLLAACSDRSVLAPNREVARRARWTEVEQQDLVRIARQSVERSSGVQVSTVGVLAEGRTDSSVIVIVVAPPHQVTFTAIRATGSWRLLDSPAGPRSTQCCNEFTWNPVAEVREWNGNTHLVFHDGPVVKGTFYHPVYQYTSPLQYGTFHAVSEVHEGTTQDTMFVDNFGAWKYEIFSASRFQNNLSPWTQWKTSAEPFTLFVGDQEYGNEADVAILRYSIGSIVFEHGTGPQTGCAGSSCAGYPSYGSLFVFISGPTSIDPAETCAYLGAAASGTEPYSFEWYRDGDLIGTGSEVATGMYGASSLTLMLIAADADGRFGNNSITVSSTGTGPCMIQ